MNLTDALAHSLDGRSIRWEAIKDLLLASAVRLVDPDRGLAPIDKLIVPGINIRNPDAADVCCNAGAWCLLSFIWYN